MFKCLLISREKKFSPWKYNSDCKILNNVDIALQNLGWDTEFVYGESFGKVTCENFDLILTMCNSHNSLKRLIRVNHKNIRVINNPMAIIRCFRSNMLSILSTNNFSIPIFQKCSSDSIPKLHFTWPPGGLWAKRTDFHSLSAEDVIHIKKPELFTSALKNFKSRGLKSVILQNHVFGTVLKCYSVGKAQFLSCHPKPKSLDQKEKIKHIIIRISDIFGLEIFGVDLIVDPKGQIKIIDVNDWPSFSPCNFEASIAIAEYVQSYYSKKWMFKERNLLIQL